MSGITRARILLATCILFLLPARIHAISFEPTATDVLVDPGETAQAALSILNDRDQAVTYSLELVEVDLSSSDGLVTSDLSEIDAVWLHLDVDRLELDAFEEVEVIFSAEPSMDVEPEVRTFGVQILEEPKMDSGVSISSGALVLVFVAVDSEHISVTYDAELSADSRLALGLPVPLSLAIQNDGPRLIQPNGSLKITSLLGREVTSIDLNPGGYRVLAGEQRAYQVSWGAADEFETDAVGSLLREWSHFAIGFFRVQPDLLAWPGGPELDVRPVWILVVPRYTILTLIILLALAWGSQAFLKKRK